MVRIARQNDNGAGQIGLQSIGIEMIAKTYAKTPDMTA
jgi:hypothetical protein